MKKVLVIGSLNVDMVVSVDQIPRVGQTVLASSYVSHNGGKGANQAVACARFGAETYMIGAVGKDKNGKILIDSLEMDGVKAKAIKMLENENTGVAWITVDNKGENTIVVIAGANQCITKTDIEENESLLDEADIILIQLEIPLEAVEYAINKGKEKGKKIILNPAPAMALSSELLSKVDIITPNETELDILTSEDSLNTQLEKAYKLLGLGVGNVVCTMGEKGALLVNNNGHVLFPGCLVKPVDTTGAGDCFNGVLAAELANDKNIEEAIGSAIKASAISVTKKGAQPSMPNRQDVEG